MKGNKQQQTHQKDTTPPSIDGEIQSKGRKVGGKLDDIKGGVRRKSTHDGGHVVLGTRGDEHTEVRFAIVHAEVHGWGGLGLHVLVHAAWRDQQSGGVAVVPVSIS